MITSIGSGVRRRSSSLSSIPIYIGSDDEAYWSLSSSRKTSTEQKTKDEEDLGKVQSANQSLICPNAFFKLVKQDDMTKYSNETLTPGEEPTHRAFRSYSLAINPNTGRRASISLPEVRLSSEALVSRLSLVGDELEENFRKIQLPHWLERRRFSILSPFSSQGT
ncbi:unnamed protein product [Calicophoron daubneyi]|uniref:Uncharacterized protein n=1 Tax=Calicophoron daubneyi TaxID=300641 RepID=A0AAV2TP29_CALDB